MPDDYPPMGSKRPQPDDVRPRQSHALFFLSLMASSWHRPRSCEQLHRWRRRRWSGQPCRPAPGDFPRQNRAIRVVFKTWKMLAKTQHL